MIPSGIALAVLAPLTCLIDLPPLIWHIRNHNTAAISLVSWVLLSNAMSFLNALLWPDANWPSHYNGAGLCDVEAKLMIARGTALPAASLCIIRALAGVMNPDKTSLVSSAAQRRRAVVLDLVYCVGIPVVTMFLHYVVQPNRYYLIGVSGCNPDFWVGWPSIVLLLVPPMVLTLANVYYAVLVLHRLRQYRRSFNLIMASTKFTKSRFLRLFAISMLLTLGLLPTEIYMLITNLPDWSASAPYSWSTVHDPQTFQQIVMLPSQVLYDRWICVACGICVFLLFGLGGDAVGMYKAWLCKLGCGRVFPGLRHAATREAQLSSGGKAKLLGKRGGSSLRSGSSTQLSPERDLELSLPPKSPYGKGVHTTEEEDIMEKFELMRYEKTPGSGSE